jgi:hypothetical protein
MEIKEELFVTQHLSSNDCYSWTITTRLGDILRKAEKMFGVRDIAYTILGVEFISSDQPHIWYPKNCKQIVIRLNENAAKNVNQALYQLAHETIHCLSPTGKSNANILEEGLATFFSEWYMNQNGFGFWAPTRPEYVNALILVKQLILIDEEIIKKVRVNKPVISEITSDDFLQINPTIDRVLLDSICMTFN